jgi:hypothetical protein
MGQPSAIRPDLSTDADPYSGYLLYEPSAEAVGGAALQGAWGGGLGFPDLSKLAADFASDPDYPGRTAVVYG